MADLLTRTAPNYVKVTVGTYTSGTRLLDEAEKAYLDGLDEGEPLDPEMEFAIARRCLPAPETIPGEKTASWWELK